MPRMGSLLLLLSIAGFVAVVEFHWSFQPTAGVLPTTTQEAENIPTQFSDPQFIGARSGVSIASLQPNYDDEWSGSVFLFGGQDDSLSRFGDLWHYNITSSKFTYLDTLGDSTTQQTSGIGGSVGSPEYPGSRRNAAFHALGSNGRFRLFGGYGRPTSAGSGSLFTVWDLLIDIEEVRKIARGEAGSMPIWTYREVISNGHMFMEIQAEVTTKPYYPSSCSYMASWTVGDDFYKLGGAGTYDDGRTWQFRDVADVDDHWTVLDNNGTSSSSPFIHYGRPHWKSHNEEFLFIFTVPNIFGYYTDADVYRWNVTGMGPSWYAVWSYPDDHLGSITATPVVRAGGRLTGSAIPTTIPSGINGQQYALLLGGQAYPADGGTSVEYVAEQWKFFTDDDGGAWWEYMPLTYDDDEYTDGSGRYGGGDPYWSRRMLNPPVLASSVQTFFLFGGTAGSGHKHADVWTLTLPCDGDDCSVFICEDGNPTNDTDAVCGGHGTCLESWGACICAQPTAWGGLYCQSMLCEDGQAADDAGVVCNGHGTCLTPAGSCVCDPATEYGGVFCERPICSDGNFSDDTGVVCNGRGTCSVGGGDCVCGVAYWGGIHCEAYFCEDGYLHTDSVDGCSGHGTCATPNGVCVCDNANWGKTHCAVWKCADGNFVDEPGVVCAGHGSCAVAGGTCECDAGLWGPHGVCDRFLCEDGELNDVATVCSAHGTCMSAGGVCVCNPPQHYGGEFCSAMRCADGELVTDAEVVCSGHGSCSEPGGTCACEDGYRMWDCSEGGSASTGDTAAGLSSGGTAGVVFGILGFILAVIVLGVGGGLVLWWGYYRRRRKREELETVVEQMEAAATPTDKVAELLEARGTKQLADIEINHELFQIDYESLEVKECIGEGGSRCVVFKATWAGKDVAFKCFHLSDFADDDNRFDSFEKEVTILGSLSHPHILRFFGATLSPPRVGIVMEYCPNGDLREFISTTQPDILIRLRLLQETASAMACLHSKSIVHRDLKPENVLISENLECRICDFGLSKLIQDRDVTQTRAIGTSVYMAPEIFAGHYDDSVDVFAYGIMTLCVINGSWKPYGQALHPEVQVAASPSYRPAIDSDVFGEKNQWLMELIQRCWQHEPAKRPSFDDILSEFADNGHQGMLKSASMEDVVRRQREQSTGGFGYKGGSMSSTPAPKGRVALVFTDVEASTQLWESAPESMHKAMRLHGAVIRSALQDAGGYEVKTEGDSFMAAFSSTVDAVRFSLDVQVRLLSAGWPAEILSLPGARRWLASNSSTDSASTTKTTIYRGLRVRIGIHVGNPIVEESGLGSYRVDYLGPVVNKAARMESYSHFGGAIALSDAAFQDLSAVPLGDSAAELERLGTMINVRDEGGRPLKGLDGLEHVRLIFPHSLRLRAAGFIAAGDAGEMLKEGSGKKGGGMELAFAADGDETVVVELGGASGDPYAQMSQSSSTSSSSSDSGASPSPQSSVSDVSVNGGSVPTQACVVDDDDEARQLLVPGGAADDEGCLEKK